MFVNKLEIHIAKRVLALLILLTVLDIFFINPKWITLAGLVIGGAFSLVKFRALILIFLKLLPEEENLSKPATGRKNILSFALNYLIAFTLLIITAKISIYIFAGFAAGLLTVPFVIFIICLIQVAGKGFDKFK